jgi:hypothetical protein
VGEGTGRVFEAAAADGAPQPAFVPSVVRLPELHCVCARWWWFVCGEVMAGV